MTKVLIADDHAVVRRGLAQIISETMDLKVSGEAADGNEVLDLVREDAFDVVVMDLNMPGRSGLDTLKQLQVEYPKLPVLVLSMHAEDQYAVRMLRAGAAGYLTKESAAEKLVEAIRRVASGSKYMSAAVAETLLNRLDSNLEGPLHEALSDREFQVMRLLATGKTATEIGEMLSLSVKTISTYRARVLEKMNMKSNAELTHYAIKNNLIY
ncbi:MAG TPA: response regulator transcription factor [Rhodothermales bacterium]|nr:response regulator transcription factor [Rhodothermales bacterium]